MVRQIKEFWGKLLLTLVLAGALIVVITMNSKEDGESPEMSDLEQSIERYNQLTDVFRRVERAVSQSTGTEKDLSSAEGGEELKQLLIEAARKTLREFGYESLN